MKTRTKSADKAAEYRAALLVERARVAGVDQRDLEVLMLPGGTAVEDQAPLMHEQFVALRQHRMDRRKLQLIDDALGRLDRGEFGVCAECEEPIPAKRLKAVPWASYCVACQEQMDARPNTGPREVLKMAA
jgi:DnaK suppressor protein